MTQVGRNGRVSREVLERIAADRRARMLPDGRFRFDLTPEQIEGSTRAAMRLAGASREQVEERLRRSGGGQGS